MALIDYSTTDGDEYHKTRHSEILGNSKLMEGWGHYSARRYFPTIAPEMRVLEIGAGTGINLSQLRRTHSVAAVEPSPFARKLCENAGIEMFSSVEEVPDSRLFDRILMRHVLEHVRSPRDFLIAAANKLAEDGLLTIVVPCESPHAPVKHVDIDFHLYCWNQQTLSNLAKDAGLVVTRSEVSFYNGRRASLPILKWFGPSAYVEAVTLIGKITGASEIVLEARRSRSADQTV